MTKILNVVAGVLFNEKNEILLVARPENKSYPGYFEIPGGKIEKNELPEEALKRELFEELDIHICPKSIRPLTFISFSYPDFHLVMLLYKISNWGGTIFLKENQSDYKWVNLNEPCTLRILPANEGLLDILKSYF